MMPCFRFKVPVVVASALLAGDAWADRALFDASVARGEDYVGLSALIDMVKVWDGHMTVDSVAATLFIHWTEKIFSPPWIKRRAGGDLCAALAEVQRDLETSFGTWQVKWGDVNRHQRFCRSAGMKTDARR